MAPLAEALETYYEYRAVLGEVERLVSAAGKEEGFTERADSPWRMVLGPSSDLGTSPMACAIGSPATG